MSKASFFLFVALIGLATVSAACNPANCNGNGICTPNSNSCLCNFGFLGPNCNIPALNPYPTCFDFTGTSVKVNFTQKFCFQYAIENGNTLHLSMYGASPGWVAIMYNSAYDGMTGGNAFLAQFCTNTPTSPSNCAACVPSDATPCYNPYITENLGNQFFTPSLQTAAPALIASAGMVNSTWSHVQFSRSVLAPNYNIPTTGTVHMSWAVGGSMAWIQHNRASVFSLTANTGVVVGGNIPPSNAPTIPPLPTSAPTTTVAPHVGAASSMTINHLSTYFLFITISILCFFFN